MTITSDTTTRRFVRRSARTRPVTLRAASPVQNTRYELTERAVSEDVIAVEYTHQHLLDREVVIKRLLPGALSGSRLRRAFMQEVRALALLRHPNIAQVYEAGSDGDQPYVVLERLQGVALDTHLTALYEYGEFMDLAEVAEIMQGIADAVATAHRNNVRVYNLEPTNIVLTDDGQPVLASLGMAPIAMERLSPVALAYLAPEYFTGELVDGRADVYALGALLAHLLVGLPPFEGSAESIVTQKETAQTSPRIAANDLPAGHAALLQVARRAMHPRADSRFADVSEFYLAFAAALPSRTAVAALSGFAPLAAPVVPELPAAAAPVVVPPLPVAPKLPVVAQPQAPLQEAFVMPPMGDASTLHGMDRPELRAALPFTILVPMPEAPAVAPTAHAAPATLQAGAQMYIWVLLLLAVAVSVSAAMMLG